MSHSPGLGFSQRKVFFTEQQSATEILEDHMLTSNFCSPLDETENKLDKRKADLLFNYQFGQKTLYPIVANKVC